MENTDLGISLKGLLSKMEMGWGRRGLRGFGGEQSRECDFEEKKILWLTRQGSKTWNGSGE